MTQLKDKTSKEWDQTMMLVKNNILRQPIYGADLKAVLKIVKQMGQLNPNTYKVSQLSDDLFTAMVQGVGMDGRHKYKTIQVPNLGGGVWD